ncbi:hypothetical protein DL237_07955 [Pseudooceanicola sediminis]|uniref:DUF5337 domain-containing protein n=2 Tax=Pseudooceanicola sediminis TaxID=2211117 RepID=A0A399J3R8_9RHOB|nr:DUF5337 domain-containing protein [Pseudooceanicola sediminis]KAA2316175.1 hypothetical protein E0K93_04810 [Puniceibacterium sp. HSS470]RII39089.1 hypothetical protein DL237_07955 [Pseudooceanicola sediminis]|tara:strand:+ start:93366 stop:93602 length:237 start_codon:yes stop_codon:yes gene_type:complete
MNMTGNRSAAMAQARKARMVGIVIAATMVVWMGLQFLGGTLGLPERYAFLFDFAAIAALIWALVVTAQIWRARRDDKG